MAQLLDQLIGEHGKDTADVMSDVNRYIFEVDDGVFAECVLAEDFDAALAREAALREELSTAKRNEHNSEVAYKAAIEKQKELREELRDSNQKLDRFYSRSHGIKNLSTIEILNDKLTAAEQRNDAFACLLNRSSNLLRHSGFCMTADEIDAALKPKPETKP